MQVDRGCPGAALCLGTGFVRDESIGTDTYMHVGQGFLFSFVSSTGDL